MRHLVQAEHGESDEDDDEDDTDALPGLYYPVHYAVQTWLNFKEHGVLPEPGGWNAQDWRLVECDWIVVSDRYARTHRQLYPLDGQKDRQKGGDDDIPLPEPGEAPDWMDILK